MSFPANKVPAKKVSSPIVPGQVCRPPPPPRDRTQPSNNLDSNECAPPLNFKQRLDLLIGAQRPCYTVPREPAIDEEPPEGDERYPTGGDEREQKSSIDRELPANRRLELSKMHSQLIKSRNMETLMTKGTKESFGTGSTTKESFGTGSTTKESFGRGSTTTERFETQLQRTSSNNLGGARTLLQEGRLISQVQRTYSTNKGSGRASLSPVTSTTLPPLPMKMGSGSVTTSPSMAGTRDETNMSWPAQISTQVVSAQVHAPQTPTDVQTPVELRQVWLELNKALALLGMQYENLYRDELEGTGGPSSVRSSSPKSCQVGSSSPKRCQISFDGLEMLEKQKTQRILQSVDVSVWRYLQWMCGTETDNTTTKYLEGIVPADILHPNFDLQRLFEWRFEQTEMPIENRLVLWYAYWIRLGTSVQILLRAAHWALGENDDEAMKRRTEREKMRKIIEVDIANLTTAKYLPEPIEDIDTWAVLNNIRLDTDQAISMAKELLETKEMTVQQYLVTFGGAFKCRNVMLVEMPKGSILGSPYTWVNDKFLQLNPERILKFNL